MVQATLPSAKRFGGHHQAAFGNAVCEQSHRDRQQEEGQCLRGGQSADLTRPSVQGDHGNQRHSGQADLLGRLGSEISARQAFEYWRKGLIHYGILARRQASVWPETDPLL